jgi:hypothetical protein
VLRVRSKAHYATWRGAPPRDRRVERDIDELPDGTLFGVLRRFDVKEPETYIWLEGLDVLRLADADPRIRTHVAWALKQPQPV